MQRTATPLSITIAFVPGEERLCSKPSGWGGWKPLNRGSRTGKTCGGGLGSRFSVMLAETLDGRMVWMEVMVMVRKKDSVIRALSARRYSAE